KARVFLMYGNRAVVAALVAVALAAVSAVLVLRLTQPHDPAARGHHQSSSSGTHPPAEPIDPLGPDVGVADLAVDGRPVSLAGRVTVTGPAAVHRLSGRFLRAAAPGERFFVITTPLLSPDPAKDSRYVQGEIKPNADRSWALIVHIARDGTYY